MEGYLWSDAWLLQSIINANRGGDGSLEDILEMADFTNKAPINDDELQSGLVRLTQGGYIAENNFRFSVTEKVPDNLKIGDDIKKVGEYLNAEEWSKEKNVRDTRNNLKYPGLTTDIIRHADRAYCRRVAKEIREIGNQSSDQT